jgi:hypothetical protein
MNKKSIITALLALVALTGWAQEIKMNETTINDYIPMKTDIETYRTEHPFTFSLPLGIRFTW